MGLKPRADPGRSVSEDLEMPRGSTCDEIRRQARDAHGTSKTSAAIEDGDAQSREADVEIIERQFPPLFPDAHGGRAQPRGRGLAQRGPPRHLRRKAPLAFLVRNVGQDDARPGAAIEGRARAYGEPRRVDMEQGSARAVDAQGGIVVMDPQECGGRCQLRDLGQNLGVAISRRSDPTCTADAISSMPASSM